VPTNGKAKILKHFKEMKKIVKEEIENTKRAVFWVGSKSRKFNNAMGKAGNKARQVSDNMDKTFEKIMEVYGGEEPCKKKKEQHE
jgi:hypothetical protein